MEPTVNNTLPDNSTADSDRAALRWFLLVVGVLYLPLVFLGYGTDGDTYATLEMGRYLRETGIYHPSRYPGYPVFELTMAALAPLGGSVLTNLTSLGMALWSLALLHVLTDGLDRARRLVVLAGVAVHPLFVIAATSTHDMMWALAFMLATAVSVQRGRPLRAGLWMGLACATRLQMAPVTAGFLLYGAWSHGVWRDGVWHHGAERRRWAGGGALALVLIVVGYLPSAAVAGWSLDFLQVSMGDDRYWAGGLRLAKFAYKNLYLWGVPAAAVLLVLAARWALPRNETWRERMARPGVVMALITIVATEAMFLRYPIEKAYLLPMVPFVFLLLGSAPGLGRRSTAALVVAVAVLNLANLNLARPDVPDAATGARMGLWLERGDLFEDIVTRHALRGVDTSEGFIDTLAALQKRDGWR